LGKRIAAEEYDDPTFAVDLLSKDVRLAVGMAREAGAASLMTGVTQQMNEMAQSRGLGRKDTSVMWNIWRDLP
jgi:3-hydroxyisobutyrate dehydrogenase